MTKAIATIALLAASLGLVVPSAAAQSQSDREIAKAGVFHASDFPAGWRATKSKKSSDPFKCQQLEKAAARLRKLRTGKASSDDYERSQEQYSSGTVVFKAEDAAHRTYEVTTSRAFRRCVERGLNDEVKKSAEGYDVKVESGTVTGSGSYGDESSDASFKVTASKGGLDLDYFADLVFVRVGRSLGFYARISTSEPSEFDTPTFDGLITSATDRLTAATGGQPSGSTPQSGTTVKTANSVLGTIVVDGNGKTVYTLTNNGQQVPCTGACLQVWPAVTATGGNATGTGVNNVSTTMTAAGQQVTIDGAPVYTFSGDGKAGDTNGEGITSFGGTWNVVKASG